MNGDIDYENMSNSEIRRKTRADMERGLVDSSPDKLQIRDVVLMLLVIVAAVASTTEMSLSWGSVQRITLLTVFLYFITTLVYKNRYEKGKQRGRYDEEYANVLKNYRQEREDIYNNNYVKHIPAFCTWYKKKELREYRENLLADIDMEYDEYRDKYMNRPKRYILKQHISSEAKSIIIKANKARSIKLSAGMVLNESGEANRKKLIGTSGKQREKFDKMSNAISRIFVTIFAGTVVVNIILDFSFLSIVQWCIRMTPIISAMLLGDDSGYCNIVVTETNFKKDQSAVIKMFKGYVKEHISEEIDNTLTISEKTMD